MLRYYFLKDAKMSLASHLLKHCVITRYCGMSWIESKISRDKHSKPCFDPGDGIEGPKIDFNVSHQAGIVTLIAAIGGKGNYQVGTDVVCVNERTKHDYAHVEKNGFIDWIDMHAEMFAKSEVHFMKFSPDLLIFDSGFSLSKTGSDAVSACERRNEELFVEVITNATNETFSTTIASNKIIDQKIRRFYAMWCLREAYVKMTGEALMAPWLKDLEIPLTTAPQARQDAGHEESLGPGESRSVASVCFKGQNVTDVELDIKAIGSDYMVAGAIKRESADGVCQKLLGDWVPLNLERDVLRFARREVVE